MALPPKNISEYAKVTLENLAAHNLGDTFSLGGAFGLLHYHDYRPTHDVDAWWSQSDTNHYRARLAIETHLARIGQHRPLEQIDDPRQRAAAQEVRHWFLTEFLNALSD